MQLEDWLDDLCVRFIINLPPEELASVERICFQVEEAQWFYEDFIRPLDPSLPSLSLRTFSLRIFQHCPLFSQWSAQHHTTAFAEFLAYKSRVPVRGAIMLNENMDEVVLVKGWKKSANWSFPRGKINKDENDLDCAVREVYEETGFDIRAAGLVKSEKDMKYIEVTMREQHMRLYVFRGVPKDTYFEPKTRKEISKIEWYKLTDLPTLKKSRQHDGSGTDLPAVNANKFYMVAPFLNPLKKWIAQQRKKENRYSSHLSAPPMVPEEVTTEDDQDTNGVGTKLPDSLTQVVSDLPEVSAPVAIDPSLHLKEILSIGSHAPMLPTPIPEPSHMQQVDTEKSNALLALLRGAPAGPRPDQPHTPFEQVSQPEVLRSPHVSHIRSVHLDQAQPPPKFPLQSQVGSQYLPAQVDQMYNKRYPRSIQPPAPYQQTGDPQFARQIPNQTQGSVVPPASALPKLTNHTKALLDVFKGANKPAEPPLSTSAQSLLNTLLATTSTPLPRPDLPPNSVGAQRIPDHLLGQGHKPNIPMVAPNPVAAFQSPSVDQLHHQISPTTVIRKPENAQQTQLLGLFNQALPPKSDGDTPQYLPHVQNLPAELAATGSTRGQRKSHTTKDDLLLTLLRQGNQEEPRKAPSNRPLPREGETSATINGPLNQPEFEVVSRTTKHIGHELGRSPLTSNRTLFDPKQPTPVKILTRSEESRQPPPRSPRGPKVTGKRTPKDKPTPKEQSKPFQPQILRRPQTTDSEQGVGATEFTNQQVVQPNYSLMAQNAIIEVPETVTPTRETSRPDGHKQTLLSLFGGSVERTPKAPVAQPGYTTISPLSPSQVVSPSTEVPVSGIDPISTRPSRVGSLASIGSGPGPSRAANEKRQTGAENKAFLLGYLGRIANQEN